MKKSRSQKPKGISLLVTLILITLTITLTAVSCGKGAGDEPDAPEDSSGEEVSAAQEWREAFPDATDFVAAKNEALYGAEVKMWYTYPEDLANDAVAVEFQLIQDPERSLLVNDMCQWAWADTEDIPGGRGRISIGNDESSCFTFVLGSDIVIFTSDDGTGYLTAALDKDEVYGDYDNDYMSEKILETFSSYEFGRRWYMSVDDNFDTGEEIVEEYFGKMAAYLGSMTPDNIYSVADFRLLDFSIDEETSDTLTFHASYAVKPLDEGSSPLWISGNAAYGSGEWEGYITDSIFVSLGLADGIWITSAAGAEVAAGV